MPDPNAGPDKVVVDVKASGICLTDYDVLKDTYGTGAIPVVPGHEYAGVVVEVGGNVTNMKARDHVAVDPNIECGICRACKPGWAHLCENPGAYRVTTHGGFAELSVLTADRVHHIGDMSFLRGIGGTDG